MNFNIPPRDSEVRKVWAVAWPLILTNMLNAAVGIIDFKMVGRLGVVPIAAVGMARTVMMIVMVLMIAISGGASVMVAHAYGRKDQREVSRIAAKSIVFMLAAALFIVTPVGLLISRFLLAELGGEPKVVELGTQYLHVLFTGSVISMFNFALTGILLGVGKTKISLVLLICVNILNVGFNAVLIFGYLGFPAFGVAGAALGTLFSRGLGTAAGLWILRSRKFPIRMEYRDFLSIDTSLLRKILYLGGPRSLQGIVRNFSRLMILWILSFLPDKTRAVSAYSVGMQVRMLSAFIGLAFMSAAMSRVGQNMGAGDPDRAEKSGWIAGRMAFVLLTCTAIIFLIFPGEIMGFFTEDERVISKGIILFIAIALTEPLMALAFALSGALRGGGDSISPFIYGSVSDLVVVILAGYILSVPLDLGFTGIALGIGLSAVTRAVPTVWKFKKGDWKEKRLLHDSAE